MSNNLNYCMLDVKSTNGMCANSENIITKYSEDVKLIPCTSAPSASNNTNTWNCTDRGACNMGDGSYQKWLISQQTNLSKD